MSEHRSTVPWTPVLLLMILAACLMLSRGDVPYVPACIEGYAHDEFRAEWSRQESDSLRRIDAAIAEAARIRAHHGTVPE